MVKLLKMTNDYYEAIYKKYCINELAKQCVDNGLWEENDSYKMASKEQRFVLPCGTETKGHYLFTINKNNNDEIVGEIWIGTIENENEDIGFIYDIHINELEQNKGFGKEAIKEIEIECIDLGFKKIRLHVFDKNEQAKEVYRKTGFKEYGRKDNSIWLEKRIEKSI